MVDEHNDPLSTSNEEFRDLRLRLRQLPNRPAPTALIRSLKREFVGPTWRDRFVGFFVSGPLWRPIGAFALSALIAGVWVTRWKTSEANLLDVQPLMAAHARYQNESLVPPGDLAGSGFGFQLASYYGEAN